jgi:hypothetical protein
MSGINDGVELSEQAIDEIIASGDADAIEAAMAQASHMTTEIDVDPNDSSIVAVIDTIENNPALVAESDVFASQSQAAVGVSTKNGEGVIPYEVLTQTREQLSLVQQSEQSVLAENAELKTLMEEQTRLLALNKTQFEANDLAVPVLPEHEKIDLENLDDYGDIGKAVRILSQQNEQMKNQLASQSGQTPVADSQGGQVEPTQDETHAAINANADLKKIFDDPATREQVIAIDNALMKSHSHLSMKQRFEMVVTTHSQNIDTLIANKTPEERAVPSSMSDASGETYQPEVSGYDRLLGASEVQQAQVLDNMSDAALDKLFNDL